MQVPSQVHFLMTNGLDIHPASREELIAAHRNVFDIWSKGLPMEEHVRYRLNSPSHSRATWFVGTVDGRVVTSLGCYPVRFCLRGQEVPGIAIGSVYTVDEFRGHGFAPRLLSGVEDHARRRQVALSVLYSDIGADYYARLGYVLCPSLEGWAEARKMPPPGGSSRLVSLSAKEHLPAIMKLYADYHGVFPLSFARDADYWVAILKKNATDEFYALQPPNGPWQGYVRIGRKGDDWRITDFALADQSDALAEELYAALGELARAGGAARVGGWLCDSASAKKFFQLTPRPTEITMIKPLTEIGPLGEALIAGISRFCEIDHV
jgi:predicted N-acetyltransferase YhbS